MRRYPPFLLILAVLLPLDQLTKRWVMAKLALHQSIPVLGDLFRITYVLNRGGIFGIGVGFVIRHILSDGFRFSFPYSYAIMFGLSALLMTASSTIFALCKEPIQPVRDKRRPLREHLKRGPHFLKIDPDYRYFVFLRVFFSFSAMGMPFYIPYALDRIGIDASAIGWYTAAGATSAVISNALWVYVGEKHGSRYLLIISSVLAGI